MRRIFAVIQAVLMALSVASCASKNDNAEAAKAIARQWIGDNIDTLSDKLGSVISSDYPKVGTFAISALLGKGLTWEYSAYREKTDRWRVTVVARLDMGVPLTGKTLKLSGDIPMRINTASGNVIETDFDPKSFKYSLSDTNPPPAPVSSSAPAGTGTIIAVANDCDHPIKFWLRYRKNNGDWYITGGYQFDAKEDLSNLLQNGNRITTTESEVWYYAESLDGSNLRWSGDLARQPIDRNDEVKFKRVTVDPSAEKSSIRTSCD